MSLVTKTGECHEGVKPENARTIRGTLLQIECGFLVLGGVFETESPDEIDDGQLDTAIEFAAAFQLV